MSSEILGSRLKGSTLIVETPDGEEIYDSKFLVAATLIHVARGGGKIEPEESSLIIDLIEEHFHLQGAESLELITRALEETVDNPALLNLLTDLAATISDREKEEIALMGLKVVAADGRRDVAGDGTVQRSDERHGYLPRNRAPGVRPLLRTDHARFLARGSVNSYDFGARKSLEQTR